MSSEHDWHAVRLLFAQLVGAKRHSFPAQGNDLDAPTERGVYIISEGQRVLHVGQTPRGKEGINQRLTNHLNGQSSFVKKYLRGDKQRLRDSCEFRCLPVQSNRMRFLLEAYATGVLCPEHPQEPEADEEASPDA